MKLSEKTKAKRKEQYYRDKANGLCTWCHKPLEADRAGLTKCLECSKRGYETEKKRRGQFRRWIPVSTERFPSEEVEEVLVTNRDGEVFILSNWGYITWEEILIEEQDCIAWMTMPKPYEEEEQ